MPSLQTPMMRQYYDIKNTLPDCILFYRLGDFYEMFDDDARLVSAELDLMLTTRDRNAPPEEQTPMCGVPFHSSEAYIARLIERGYSVAICEQIGDPAQSKGLVERKVERRLTPGTVTESTCLDEGVNNYLCALCFDREGVGLCFADVSAGQIYATQLTAADGVSALRDELARFAPREIIVARSATLWDGALDNTACTVSRTDDDLWQPEAAGHCAELAFGPLPHAAARLVTAVGATVGYMQSTQQQIDGLLGDLQLYQPDLYVALDASTRRHLELCESLSGGRRGSLLAVLDKTVTPMGKRLLRNWLQRPLRSVQTVNERLDAVEFLTRDTVVRGECAEAMKGIGDMERLIGRICAGTANARDLMALCLACEHIEQLKRQTVPLRGELLARTATAIESLSDIALLIGRTLVDNPPLKAADGKLIKIGYNDEVDRLHNVVEHTKELVAAMEATERERTGIKTLKIGYNRVFGYYIEISKGQSANAPAEYDRKQTLANGERFTTPELKEMETTILTARDRLQALEEQLFLQLRADVAAHADRIRGTAAAIAQLDVLVSLAAVAVARRYARPQYDDSDTLAITEGRHPVVEALLKDSPFVPNDVALDGRTNTVMILTGPNMAGKSTYMRQVALIALMAQMGSFVPAKQAHIGQLDAVFTRIGASDDLTGGQSTFMVEMSEVSHILAHATKQSLLILDEVGRGTSTFDGMAVAQAVLEYVADAKKIGARTIFATHYHELADMEHQLPNVVNYNVTAKKRGDDIVFLRKVVRGSTVDSYGVEVAKLAGLPSKVINRAQALVEVLEANAFTHEKRPVQPQGEQLSLGELSAGEVVRDLADLSLDTLSPIEAMNVLYKLHAKAKEVL